MYVEINMEFDRLLIKYSYQISSFCHKFPANGGRITRGVFIVKENFSVEAFWNKVKTAAIKAGHSVIYTSLLLFYVLQKRDVPKRVKFVIIGSLAYFIAPIDVIPDFVAGLGYTDDLGALTAALIQAAMYVDEEVKEQARTKLGEWFGSDVDTSLIDQKLDS